MVSEILRKLNSKNEVIVIISIMFALNLILVNSKPIIVGKETIKQEMPEWVGTVERYDDPDITDPEEIWGF